jgi:putative DNA primase/helicase
MPDPAMREYLQTVMGYSITAKTTEQAYFIHWGPTNNGKSVLMGLVRRILGSQMASASSKALIKSRNDKHSVEIADLAGPRLLQMSETAEGAALEEEIVKQVTGRDWVAARKIAQSNQDWKIEGKIHILTNYLPHISASPSMRRRTHLIIWPVEITGDAIDLDLEDKIAAHELSGVLNWLVSGCLRWQENLKAKPAPGERKTGLLKPHQAVMDLERYMEEEDQLAEWISDRTEEGGPTKAGQLYEDYRIWCFPKGIKPMSATAFGRKLREKKIEKTERSAGNYYGLVLTGPNVFLS